MTRPWWDDSRAAAALNAGVPVLLPGGRQAAIAALQRRISGFVPEWRDLSAEDAGVALVRLFGLQLEPILARAERLPEKAFVEFLRAAGVTLAAARSAAAIVTFVPDPRNDAPVEVPPGTRLLSARADDQTGDVTWETDAPLSVPNLTLRERHVADAETALAIAEGQSFAALGERPEVGAALYLGFTGAGTVAGKLSIAFQPAQNGEPPPVAAGGAPPPGRPAAMLRWEGLTERGFQLLDVDSDATAALTRTGIVTLVLPRNLAAGRPATLGTGDELFWLRLRLAGGRLEPPPRVQAIHLHAVDATAKQTFRDEFPVPETDAESTFMRLAHAPVLQHSVVLDVDEGAVSTDLFELEDPTERATGGTFRRWGEVATLAGQRPDARVYVLDSASGVIRFGDGRQGRALPPGIRAVAVRAYATTLGAAGNVAADEITRAAVRTAGIARFTNPFLGEGGTAAETRDAAIRYGPARLKARERAVSTGDIAALARGAPGVLKAYALSGVDPALAGASRPGTVGVYVVPRRHPSLPADTPPVATSQTLGAVAKHFATTVGPLGARVVAASPRYEEVRIEATLTIAAGADAAAVTSAVRAALDAWLSPETGDWRLGPTLRHTDLTHVVLEAHENVSSVRFLAVTLDGIELPACADAALRRFSLPWPGRHRLIAEAEAVGP